MRIAVLLGIVLATLAPSLSAAAESAGGTASAVGRSAPPLVTYRLQAGDVVDIKLFYSPELNESATVLPDGHITLQLIGQVTAAGQTVPGLTRQLQERYSSILRAPEISVIVRQFSAPKVYVAGEVARPGELPLQGGLTALEAIVRSGSFTRDAKADSVAILRYRDSGEPEVILLDMAPQIQPLATWAVGGNPEPERPAVQNVRLEPLDIVYVPITTIASVGYFFERYFNNIVPIWRNLGVYIVRPN
jgi:protein involved in polysaccharide export with SLBB domain